MAKDEKPEDIQPQDEQEEEGGLERHPDKAQRFFERAGEVANTGSYDFAIELYRDGLKWDPEAMDEGHKPMREVALRRKQSGGKKPGFIEQAKINKVRDPKEKMVEAEYLLAKDPENPRWMEMFIASALKVGAAQACRWMARLLVEGNIHSGKPSLERFLTAKDAFKQLGDHKNAVTCLQHALKLKPNDQALLTEMKNESALSMIQDARLEEEGDFTKSVKDMKGQKELLQDDSLIKSKDVLSRQVAEAKAEYEAEPTVPGKIFSYVDALVRRGNDGDEDQAIAVLNQAWKASNSYRYKERLGEIRIRQSHRRFNEVAQKATANRDDAELKRQALEMAQQVRDLEEKEFAERVANYPTDMRLKYEYGRRLFVNKKFDDAIPVLQEATNEPKNRLRAMNLLGQSFLNMDFYSEAVATFRRAIEGLEITGDDVSKDLYYNLGRALEANGDLTEADQAYSQVLQWDFKYKDVRQRTQQLRAKKQGSDAGSGQLSQERT